MAQTQDHYEVLQVHPSAHPDVIQAAYRRLALLYHPDRNPSAEAARMMAQINVAFEVLSDPQRRADYDRERGASSGYTSYTPPYEQAEPAAAASEPYRESQSPPRRVTRIPFVATARSAIAVIKWQVGFFGRAISVIAGVIALLPFALLGFSDSIGAALLAFPFAVITSFWWWFLASVILFVAWKVFKRGRAMARSLIRGLRHAGDGGDVIQSEDARHTDDQDALWADLRAHLAVLSRTAGGAVLGTARFFGWPISAIALLLMLLGTMSNVAEITVSELFPVGTSATDGVFLATPVWLLIFVLSWPAFVLSMFVIWLFWAVIIFTVWQWIRLIIMIVRSSGKSRDEER